ncbi:DUF1467 family protein [Thalassospira sp.]|uniref:DUF1467 family protein n=1 Tax=Thalassospira sp. TaxID=1912094 RepID=UPI002733A2EC|nr:DUF1467 family protein [Thalassospira sp.]MDP2697768.1 DUF1467 family protein [Thalassospira sp.]
MNWFSAILVYIVIWWLVLFMVLPFGVNRPAKIGHGHASGAPEKPHMWKKILATSLISVVLWGVAYAVITSGIIEVRPPA